jgi:HlyD family secretion protein
VVFASVAGLAAAVPALAPWHRARSPLEGVATATVRRADLDAEVVAAGRVESAESTEIRCTLERLDVPGLSGGLTAGGASTILKMIPDGSTVKQGDVLCELDASSYAELVRRQKIAVKQARADHEQVALERDVARIDLRAYRDGEQRQREQQRQGQIALARSDLTRQTERVDWVRRMRAKGYASAAQVASEEQALRRMTLGQEQMVMVLRNFQRFTAPKELLSLQSQVTAAEAMFDFQSIRLKREEERLAHSQSLVERCTVRAPHDGFVIYANRPDRSPQVYIGAPVRERLRLFYLPDLSKMEVGVLVHETVVSRLRAGMAARVRVEALPGREMAGRLVSVSRLPLTDRKSETGTEVTYFVGRVQLTTLPEGLRPGMSAG